MEIIKGNPKTKAGKTHNIKSDKSFDDICKKFEEMEAEGGVRVVAKLSFAELEATPVEQLTSTQRKALMSIKKQS